MNNLEKIRKAEAMEEWRPIKGYEGIYEVSNFGRVKSLSRYVKCKNGAKRLNKERVLKGVPDTKGYLYVSLWKNSSFKRFILHKLVANILIPNPEEKDHVNHKDGVKTNNAITNLEWCSKSEDVKHAYKNGLNKNNGERNHLSKLKDNEVLKIKDLIQKKFPLLDIANRFSISLQTIKDIKRGKTWMHI